MKFSIYCQKMRYFYFSSSNVFLFLYYRLTILFCSRMYTVFRKMDVFFLNTEYIYIFIRHKAASKQTNNCTNRQTDKRQKKKQENNANNAILRLCLSLLRRDTPNPRTAHSTPAAPPQRTHTTPNAILSN